MNIKEDPFHKILITYPITNNEWKRNSLYQESLMSYIKNVTKSDRLNKKSLKICMDCSNVHNFFIRERSTQDSQRLDPWHRTFPMFPGIQSNRMVIEQNTNIEYDWYPIINYDNSKTYNFIYVTSLDGIKIYCIDTLSHI